MKKNAYHSENIFTRHPLTWFFLFSYVLSWWPAPFMGGQLLPHGPALAAVLVIGLTRGKRGVATSFRRSARHLTTWGWFIAGPAVIITYHGLAFLINLLLGAGMEHPPNIAPATVLELLLLGGLWEEPGWTGFALPRLQERFSRLSNAGLVAALVLGVFRGLWHLPLYLYGHIPWFDIFVFNFAFQLIITWVYIQSEGSVLAVMLLHFVSNFMGAFTQPMFTGEAHTTYTMLFMSIASLTALGIAAQSRFKLDSRKLEVSIAGVRSRFM